MGREEKQMMDERHREGRQRAEYRSAQRSRERIRAALLHLLETQDPHRITVSELVRVAGVNRTTFYAHYPDVHGVFEEIVQEVVDKLREVLSNARDRRYWRNPGPLLEEVNRFLRQNEQLYRVLLRQDGAEHYMEQLKEIFVESIAQDPSLPPEMASSISFRLQLMFCAGGIENLYCQWLQGSVNCTLEELEKELVQIVQGMGVGSPWMMEENLEG